MYATGFSYGADFDYDWATLKFAADGTLRWERRLDAPGRSDDRAADMALLPDGNVVVSGVTQPGGEQFPDNDAETVAYDPQGTIVWQARWSDTAASHEFVFDLDVDASGRIAITGTTQENTSPYVPPFPLTLRYDAGGALVQTIRSDGGASVDVDAAGNVFVAGTFVTSPSTVAKFSASGARVWSAPLTVGAGDALSWPFVAADSAGAVTVAGTVSDTSTGSGDYLTIRFAPDGRELWRHRFGGVADPGQQDQVAGVAIDAAGAALVTGTSWNGYLSIGGTATDIVTLRFPAGTAPALTAPSQLDATGVSRSEIRLRWQDNAGTEDGFRIERCVGNRLHRLRADRGRRPRCHELPRQRAGAQYRVLVSRPCLQRRGRVRVFEHGDREDPAQVMNSIRRAGGGVYPGVVSVVRRGPTRRLPCA